MERFRTNWHKYALAAVMLAAAFLNFWELSREGLANTYYAAAVSSMLKSWHNFFFVSLDAKGFISIDKPPLGFWMQAISAKVFGFHGWALLLPQALAGVLSTGLLYVLVAKPFGRAAGVLAALALALTPIAVAISRNNSIDSQLVLVLLAAAWCLLRSIELKKLRWLVASAVLVGLGFNIKMMQAYMVLPAFLVLYAIAAKFNWKKKIIHLALAAVVLLGVSFSWALAVDAVPADQRPYVGSSSKNSVVDLILGYNGTDRWDNTGTRLGGGGGGNRSGRTDGNNQQNGMTPPDGVNSADGNGQQNGMTPPDGMNSADGNVQQGMTPPNGMQFPRNFEPGKNGMGGPGGMGGGPGGAGETGQAGVLRLFSTNLFGQISWLLPFALCAALALFWRPQEKFVWNERRQSALLWTLWLAPMLVFFSYASFFHRYYLVMLAPAIAALFGAGLTQMWNDLREKRGFHGWWLLASIAITAATTLVFLSNYTSTSQGVFYSVAILAVLACLGLIWLRLTRDLSPVKTGQSLVALVVLAALFTGPTAWALTPTLYGGQSTLPYAGPDLKRQSGGMGMGGGGMQGMPGGPGETTADSKLIDFLKKNYVEGSYLVGVSSAMQSDPIILETGLPVMTYGGFQGNDPALTPEKLQKLVNEGQIRYILIGGGGGAGGDSQSELTAWVKAHGTAVPESEWRSTRNNTIESNTNESNAKENNQTNSNFGERFNNRDGQAQRNFGPMGGMNQTLYDLKAGGSQ
ncbi:glycosyltransferase family 39 protein [Tumebacillus flagellatus]|uniref:Uncharacterized protein n=1 Tax=Tumebacillus flagellatus TaxID=1157490 RepID=A0A074LS49_9BACL|nr:glycosyltransferase family 39 protein [Tumebacillus flagellatus]KEO83949.1 hypothetical protein EL26_07100 [Tumebacillus flagellatus]